MMRRTGGRRALVTGGADLIGSHLSELLLREGYSVRILDNLEPQTHRRGRPPRATDAGCGQRSVSYRRLR